LIYNKTYCVQFFVSLEDNNKYATDAIHALLTTDSVVTSLTNCFHLPYNPQVKNTLGNFISDTLNWMSISGEFKALGGEKFLTIGNFNDDINTNIDTVGWGSYSTVYYYIDDVSVTVCDTTAVKELQSKDYRLQIYPNPASGSVTITVKGGDEIIITDIAGRKIKTIKNFQNSVNFSTDEIDGGIYFLTLYSNNTVISTRKLVVAK